MKKNYSFYFLLLAVMLLSGRSFAQTKLPCYTDEMRNHYKQRDPVQYAIFDKQLEDETTNYLKRKAPNSLGRTTATTDPTNDSFYFDIPVVVHVMHQYGVEVVPDNSIYALISEMNRFYSKNYNTSGIVPEFQRYIGTPRFRFHLAAKDPNGNPTRGITHHYTYLAAGGDDQGKLDQWPPTSYLNIWFEELIGAKVAMGTIVAYATQPAAAAENPFYDGIICNYQFVNDTGTHAGGSIDHETGHIFNLYHTFGETNDPQTPGVSPVSGNCDCATCSDKVDDTPPTDGQLGLCNLYDTVCATNYFMVYPSSVAGIDSIADYPDTSYEQDIMNYADCSKEEFTLGQIARMRAAALSTVAGRSNLWSVENLMATGILESDGVTFAPTPSLSPIADFAVKNSGGNATSGTVTEFTIPGVQLNFINESFQDTVTSINWTFSNGATIPETTATASTVIKNKFTDPGWVSMTMAVVGNHNDTTTATYPRAAYVAQATGVPGDGYYMDFDNSDTSNWPMFNYYNNEFKWQIANVGYDDNSCLQYVGYDYRLNPATGAYPLTGTPIGDYDDVFSRPMDLSAFTDTCNLNFLYSAASRSGVSYNINDTLEIAYSSNSVSWTTIAKLDREKMINKGPIATAYTPGSQSDWATESVGIPHAARLGYVIFRLRYRPNVSVPDPISDITYSTGNNFYMDKVNFSRLPASVSTLKLNNLDVVVVPNPTNGDAYVVVKDDNNVTAKIVVSDITGKVIYTTSEQVNGEARIQIPHSAISVSGVYMVQTITGTQVNTKKLVVE